MSGRIVLVAAVTLAGLCAPVVQVLRAQNADASADAAPAADPSANPAPDAPVVATSASSDYPQVSVSSSDPFLVADAIQLAEDTRDQLSPILKLGPQWRFAVHIRIMAPDDPLLAKINREAAGVFAEGSTMRIEAVAPSTDPNLREFVQRQFITALLWERFFAKTTTFDRNTHLDVVPAWLVEGLREWVTDDPEHNRENIVRRAVHNQMAPTLAEVTGWHELSNDRLLGLWQRAFCFYLVDSIVEKGARRDDFQQWLDGFASENPSPAQYHFPTESAWQRELADASSRSRQIVYTWDETLAELTADQTITFVIATATDAGVPKAPNPTGKDAAVAKIQDKAKDAKVETCSIFDVTAKPHTVPMFEAIKERIDVLTELELRSHSSWNPVIDLYRSALTVLIKDNNVDLAKKQLEQAHRLFLAETGDHQKLVDYVNWFEVTKDYAEPTHFSRYFDTASEMERVEADPAHPNPIRANLLQIESEL